MGNIQERMIHGVQVSAEFETEDSLAVLLKSIRLEGLAPRGSVRTVLEKQARTIVDKVNYLDGEMRLIEIDGLSNAVQIRSKPAAGKDSAVRFVEVILRNGNLITVEARGGALLVSKENYERLVETLAALL